MFKLSLLVVAIVLPNQLISPHRVIAPNLFSFNHFYFHGSLQASALSTSYIAIAAYIHFNLHRLRLNPCPPSWLG